MSENPYAPGTYAKGDDVRVANTTRDAVALVFEGFKPVADEPIVEQSSPQEPVNDEQPKVETKTPTTLALSPRELARKQSQEDDKS